MRSIIDIFITWKCHLSNNCITQCICMPGTEDSQIAWLLKRSLLIWIEILSRSESTAFILSTSIYFPSCSSSSLLCLSFLGKMSCQFLLLFFFFFSFLLGFQVTTVLQDNQYMNINFDKDQSHSHTGADSIDAFKVLQTQSLIQKDKNTASTEFLESSESFGMEEHLKRKRVHGLASRSAQKHLRHSCDQDSIGNFFLHILLLFPDHSSLFHL